MSFCARKSLVAASLFVFVLLAPRIALSKPLNLSTDLISQGIYSCNMIPNDQSVDSGPALTAALRYATAHGITSVVANRGAYYFNNADSSGNEHVYLTGINNVKVNFHNSDLYFAKSNIMGFDIHDCQNLTLENFTADDGSAIHGNDRDQRECVRESADH